ncbi:MAG: hypothetical protein ACLGG5_05735, partial [Thermoleophilia bacterium]
MFRVTIAYFAVLAATAGLVPLLNALDAGPAVSVTALASLCVSVGLAIAYFIDRIPEISRPRRARRRP